MKLIDEKGRLLGKINVFDLAVLLIILVGIAGVYYKFGYLNKISGQTGIQNKATIGFVVREVSSYSADAVAVGGIVKELKSNTEIGTITRAVIKPATKAASDMNGKWVLSEIPDKKDIFIYIETTANYDPDMKLGSVNAKVGAKIEIKGPKFQFESYICGVEPK